MLRKLTATVCMYESSTAIKELKSGLLLTPIAHSIQHANLKQMNAQEFANA